MRKQHFQLIQALLLIFLPIVTISCGFQNETIVLEPLEKPIHKTYQFDHFDEIESDAPILLEISQGEGFSIERTQRFKDIDKYISVERDGNTLKIKRKSDSSIFLLKDSEYLAVFRVSMPKITSITQSSSGKIVAQSAIQSERLTINTSCAAVVWLKDIRCSERFKWESSGAASGKADRIESGDIDIEMCSASNLSCHHFHAAKDLNLNGSGASEFKIMQGECANAAIELSGVAAFKAHDLSIRQDLNANVSGKSNILVEKGAVDGHSEIVGSGKSSLNADGFLLPKCELELSGMSEMRLHVTQELHYSCSGKSMATILGQPKKDGACSGESELNMQ